MDLNIAYFQGFFSRLVDDKDVMLEMNKPINTTISKTTSRLFQYIFPNSTNADEMVLLTIKATSNTHQCSLVSVQPINSNQVNRTFKMPLEQQYGLCL